MLVSPAVLAELRDVLGRRQFRRYLDEEDIVTFLDVLAQEGRWVDVEVEVSACRDPKDNRFLSLAISGGATHLITGDKDLLALDPFQGVRILTPHAFLELP